MAEKKDFPANAIRGISDPNALINKHVVSAHLFYFDLHNPRQDGWHEQSINWEDQESVIDFSLAQKKDDRIQFKVGITIVPRQVLDNVNQTAGMEGTISYERAPILPDNPYHGNILLKQGVNKRLMNMIASKIALGVSNIFQQK